MTTQPTPLPPTVAELRALIIVDLKHPVALRSLEELCRRAADPAPVADEAAIEGAMMRLANTARTAGSMGMWHQLNPNQPSECADWEERVHVRASELRGLMRAAPRNDDKLRKLLRLVQECGARWCGAVGRANGEDTRDASARFETFEFVAKEIDKLLAESPAGDAGEPSCKREYDAMVKLIRDSHNGYDPAARKELGMEEPASAIVALHDLIKEQKSLEGYEVRDLRREVDDLRARLQAAEAELDEKAELLDKVIYDAKEFSGKLSDILDNNLVPDGEPLARVKEAIDMLTETILERDKLEAERDKLRKLNTAHVASVEKLQAAYDDAKKQLAEVDAERDKLAADLAAAQKERDESIRERDDMRINEAEIRASLAAWCSKARKSDLRARQARDELAAAKADGARAAVEELEGLAKVFEKNCADMRRNAMEQPTTALNGYDVQANVWMHACDAVSWRIAKLRAAQPQPTTAAPATTSDRTPKEGKQPIFWAPWRESGATVRQGDDRLSDRPACEEVVRTFNPVTATPSETWVYLQCRRALEGKP